MIKKTVTIKNSTGLHARPSAALVKLAGSFKSDFYIHMYGYRVNGKSILGVMTLAMLNKELSCCSRCQARMKRKQWKLLWI